MKAFVLFFALLLTPAILAAQSFELSITPSVQSVKLGETATYTIVIKPLNGYDATVFLSTATTSFRGTVTYSTSTPNPPYENITLQIKPTFQDTGIRTITIIAQNGDVKDTATCSIIASSSDQWTKLSTPQIIKNDGVTVIGELSKDIDGNICTSFGSNDKIYISHFRNKHWETDTILNSSRGFYSPSLVFDKNGVIWYSTFNGIARNDGKFTTVFNTSNSGIVSDTVWEILLDRNGYPVCSSRGFDDDDLTISRFDGVKWKSITVKKQSQFARWQLDDNFCIDSSNRIWIPVEAGRVVMINDTIQELIEIQNIHKIVCDKDGWIWCMSLFRSFMPDQTNLTNKAIAYYDGISWKYISSPTKYRYGNIVVDDNKHVWLASNEGLHWYNGSQWTTYDKDKSPLLDPHSFNGPWGSRGIIQDKYQNIWFRTSTTARVDITIFNPYGLVGIPLAPSAVEEEIHPPISGINLSPNPTSTSITISGIEGVRSMQMVNTLGMVVGYESLGTSSTHEVDVSNLPNGMYSMQFHTATGIISKPVVVNR